MPYAYGRRQVDPRRRLPGQPHSGRISFSMPDWEVLLRDRLPAYITWEKYLANQELLSQNQSLPGTQGAPRQGATLLSGLIRCGVGDWRMQVVYHTISGVATYHCPSLDRDGDHTQCQNVAAHALDDLVSRLVLKAVEPASLSLSFGTAEDLERERERQHGQWHQQLERAQYHVQRAKRQYRMPSILTTAWSPGNWRNNGNRQSATSGGFRNRWIVCKRNSRLSCRRRSGSRS